MESQYLEDNESSETAPEEQVGQADALYQESLGHFQDGKWQKAAAGFEEVLRLSPDHAAARAFLEETRLKASLDQDKPEPKRRSLLAGPVRYLVMFLLLAAAVVLVVLGARWAYSRWIEPPRMAQQAEIEKAQQLEQALKYLADRDYLAAEEAFRTVLAADPDNQQAQEGLAEVQEKMALAENYGKAEAAITRQDWAEAANLLIAIVAKDPRYGDAQAKLAFVQEEQRWSTALAEAEQAYQAGDCRGAVTAFEALRNLNAEYHKEVVSARLFACYVKLGVEVVETSKGAADAVQEALEWYAKALTLQPQNAQVLQEVTLAAKYLEGQELVAKGDLKAAIAALQWVYQQQPAYAGGNAAALLQASGGEVTLPTPVAATPTPVTAMPTPAVPVTPESEFQRQFALAMQNGDAAMGSSDYGQAESHYRQATAVAIHGGYDAARWLFVSHVKLGTVYARTGRQEEAAQTIRTAIMVMAQSATAIPSESYLGYVEQGDLYAQAKDYRNALTQYEQAVLVMGKKCNCGLEGWRVMP